MPSAIESHAVLICLTPPNVFGDFESTNQTRRAVKGLQSHITAIVAQQAQARAAKWQAIVLTDASDFQIQYALTTLSHGCGGDLATTRNLFSTTNVRQISSYLEQNRQKLNIIESQIPGILTIRNPLLCSEIKEKIDALSKEADNKKLSVKSKLTIKNIK